MYNSYLSDKALRDSTEFRGCSAGMAREGLLYTMRTYLVIIKSIVYAVEVQEKDSDWLIDRVLQYQTRLYSFLTEIETSVAI